MEIIRIRHLLLLLISVGFCNGQDDWQVGPFIKEDSVNPVLEPRNDTVFYCPVRKQLLRWEAKDVFNPTAIVRNNGIHLLYRAEDYEGTFSGTSRVGLAISPDGLNFLRYTEPIFYPDNDTALPYEWEGGCEDPRITQNATGTYFMTYTAYDGTLARLMVASSDDLFNWTKHGPVFRQAYDGRFVDVWSKSGSVVSTMVNETMVAAKINGLYHMYWGESNIYLATSEDLINWVPVLNEDGELKPIFGPREGKFDSALVEPGPQAILRKDGIFLIYNSKNKPERIGGDPNLPEGTYSAGQILFSASDPTIVLKRSDEYFFKPEKPYEMTGQVNNVVFLEGLVYYKNKLFLYYGTADSKIAVASAEANFEF
jgi:predicted GH43/DUF377 family glycosyl hydrolase